MNEHRSKKRETSELLPWQAALMVVCVTAAGLLHEHPEAVRPLLSGIHAAQVHAAVESGKRSSEVLIAAIRPGR